MARPRSWSLHLNDKKLMIEIDRMIRNGKKWNGEEGIGAALGTSGPNANQYYNRRLGVFKLQKSIRDLFSRIQFIEEQLARGHVIPDNGRNTSPPPPPSAPNAPPPPPSARMLLQAELKNAVKDLTSLLTKVDGDVTGAHYLSASERLD